MRTTSAAWAAALAVMTLNGATSAQAAPFLTEEEQIRAIPRIVRRQITNNTLPIVGQQNSPPRNSESPAATSKATQSQDLLDILPIVVTATATTVVTVEPSSSPAPKSSSSAQEQLLPLVVLTTTTATPSPRPTTRPASSESTTTTEDSSSQAASASSNPGLLAPLLPIPPTTTTSSAAAPTRTTTTTATTATGGGLLDLTLLPIPVPTTTTTTTTPAAPLSSTPSFLVGLSTVIESTTAATSTAPATTPLLGLTLPFNLLPTTTTTTTSATASDVATITVASSTPAANTGLLGLSLSILPTLPLSSLSVPVTIAETSTPIVTAPTSVSVPVVVSSLPVTIDTGSAVPTQSFTLTTSGISVTPVPVTSTIPSISVPIVSDTGNATATATPTALVSITPTASLSVLPPVSTSVLPPISIPTSIPGNATASTTASVPAGNTTVTTPPAISTTLTSERPPTATLPVVSIVPTGTNTLTSLPVSTGLVFATSATETGSLATALTQSTAGTMPTGIPQLIQPPGGQPSTVPNVALIQVGFTYALNYPFVAGNPTTIRQIFTFLPQGIAYGLGLNTEDVKMNALVPYNTSSSMGYITTLAQAYIPADKVNQMQLVLHQPTSNLYQNPDATVRTLMSMINPTLPLFPGASVDDPASGTNGQGSQTSSPKTDAAPIGGDSGSSSPVKGTSVGIGVGAVAGAALYAAAMVFVARRYRQKKRGHQRSPSVQYSRANMSERASGGGMGTFFMSGANGRGSGLTRAPGSRNSETSSNGRSVRDAGISAPVTSSNSLGW